MDITILGSGTPLPIPDRGGTSLAIEVGEDRLLVDCGPQTVERCVEYHWDFTEIEHLFFTHHHLDHNGAFFHFTIIGWFLGRNELTVYGPEGTADLVDAVRPLFDATIESWSEWKEEQFGQDPTAGIDDIGCEQIRDGTQISGAGWTASSLRVEHHTMETFAYRFDEAETGNSVVFSADTTKMDEMKEFARDADVLIHEANAWDSRAELKPDTEIPPRFLQSMLTPYYEAYTAQRTKAERNAFHSTPTDAAEIAEAADVETLILTHLNPYRREEVLMEEASEIFTGEVEIASDGLTKTIR